MKIKRNLKNTSAEWIINNIKSKIDSVAQESMSSALESINKDLNKQNITSRTTKNDISSDNKIIEIQSDDENAGVAFGSILLNASEKVSKKMNDKGLV